jgi:LysR family nitrogen assimilation transcriptional regulator
MDLRQLEQFVAVYEEGSFSRAARREHCTQPGLSVQIRNLEGQLGIELFTRNARGVAPTVAGKRFYTKSLAILNAVEETKLDMQNLQGAITGAIVAGTVPSVSRSALPAALSRFTEQYPNVELRLDEAYGGTLTDRVGAGELDFAVITGPPAVEGLTSELISGNTMTLVSGPESPLRHLVPYSLGELPPLRLVLPSDRHSIRQVIDANLRRSGATVETVIESDGLNTTLEYVRRSGWSTITLMTTVIDELESGGLVINPIVRPEIAVDYFLVRPSRRPLSPAGKQFIALLSEELAEITQRWQQATSGK